MFRDRPDIPRLSFIFLEQPDGFCETDLALSLTIRFISFARLLARFSR